MLANKCVTFSYECKIYETKECRITHAVKWYDRTKIEQLTGTYLRPSKQADSL